MDTHPLGLLTPVRPSRIPLPSDGPQATTISTAVLVWSTPPSSFLLEDPRGVFEKS